MSGSSFIPVLTESVDRPEAGWLTRLNGLSHKPTSLARGKNADQTVYQWEDGNQICLQHCMYYILLAMFFPYYPSHYPSHYRVLILPGIDITRHITG